MKNIFVMSTELPSPCIETSMEKHGTIILILIKFIFKVLLTVHHAMILGSCPT